MPPMYRLYIYNDPVNKRERVVDVLIKTCQGLTFSRAYAAMQEAHENGRGMVLVVCQEIAEHYCATINGGKLSFIGQPWVTGSERMTDNRGCTVLRVTCSGSFEHD